MEPRGFGGSVSICLRKYAIFRGRAPRAEYWYFLLFQCICYLVVGILSAAAGGPLWWLVDLALLLPAWGVLVRRLHDIDRSGWWLLIELIPIVGWIVLLVWYCTRGTIGPNRFGADELAPPTAQYAQLSGGLS